MLEFTINVVFILLFLLGFLLFKGPKNKFGRNPLVFLFLGEISVIIFYFIGFFSGKAFTTVLSISYFFSVLFGNFSIIVFGLMSESLLRNVSACRPYKTVKFPSNLAKNVQIFLFVLGVVGVAGLLNGLGVDHPTSLYFLVLNDYQYLENNFFNSSFALLWQALIASLFFAGLAAEDKSSKKLSSVLILILTILFLMLRGAYLYLIIGAMYFVAGYVINSSINIKKGVMIGLLACVFLSSIALLNYDINSFSSLYDKFVPYTYGNFINLSIHEAKDAMSGCASFLFGLNSIVAYMEKYFNISINSCAPIFPFVAQMVDEEVKGNTATAFAPDVYMPVILRLPFYITIGVISAYISIYNGRHIIATVMAPVVFSACFLFFASGGFLSTTRIFPSLLYILPVFVFYYLLRNRGVRRFSCH